MIQYSKSLQIEILNLIVSWIHISVKTPGFYYILDNPINPEDLYENPINLLIFQILFFHIRSGFFLALFSAFPRKAAGGRYLSWNGNESACKSSFLTLPFHSNCLSSSSKRYYCCQYLFFHDQSYPLYHMCSYSNLPDTFLQTLSPVRQIFSIYTQSINHSKDNTLFSLHKKRCRHRHLFHYFL